MAYDKHVAERIRKVLSHRADVLERRMVGGGLSFMVGGSLCCGVSGTALLVRVGPMAYQQALAKPHTRPLTFGGKSPVGYIYVDPPGFQTEAALNRWIQQSVAFVKTLTP